MTRDEMYVARLILSENEPHDIVTDIANALSARVDPNQYLAEMCRLLKQNGHQPAADWLWKNVAGEKIYGESDDE